LQRSGNDRIFAILADDYEEPEEQGSIAAFSQIGPPRNLSVDLRNNGFLLQWTPPEYGNDLLGLYVVRWYLEPGKNLQGKAETRNNYYTSKAFSVW
jgi:hypothetical protein